jgi:RHS repeat-associated protein
MQGLGEKFAPDLFTGTGNLSIPLGIPPGRGGLQPQLNLVYSSGHGNGPFGLGWALSVPGISRKTSKGVPRYQDSSADEAGRDVFILSGAEDLVPVSAEPGGLHYRPRTEGLFARIARRRDAANDYWEVRSTDGLVSTYGTPESIGHDPACVADPSDRTRVFTWKISQTRDTFGNLIEYEYERDTGDAGSHHWDQTYLKQIRYADYVRDGRTHFLVTVTFHHEDRPDAFSDHRSGFEVRTRRRCTRIEVRTHADADRLTRTYELVYVDQRNDLGAPLNGQSLLSQIKVAGHDGAVRQELPPLEFAYTRFEPDRCNLLTVTGRDLPALGDPNLELVDLFGNGLQDLLELNGVVRYWRNLGGARFDEARVMEAAPAGVSLAQAGVQLIDADGDGRIDLMVSAGALAGYYPMRFGGGWDRRSFQPYRAAPSFVLEDPEVQLVDLDGDGVTDAVRSGTRLECFFNDPKNGWTGTRWVDRGPLEEFPDVNFSDARVRWADLSGDGLRDVVLIHDGEVAYWPNRGHGRWGRRVSMRNSPRFPYGYQPRLILVGDVDGDGLADLVYVDHGRVLLWINQSGERWSDPIEVAGTPPVSDADTVRLVDLLGTGIAGVLWSRNLDAAARPPHAFLDVTGGVKPSLLSVSDNHLGATTRVEYQPSTWFYLEDEKRPDTRWRTPLPFPVHVVARVERVDALSRGKLTTEYAYHHGYWDGAEREFRGFGRVDQRDTEVFERYHDAGSTGFQSIEAASFSPPTELRTWFHQGPVGDEIGEWEEPDYSHEFWSGDANALERPAETIRLLQSLERRARRDALRTLRGHALRTELYALDGSEREARPYTVTEFAYGVRDESPPDTGDRARPHIFFSSLQAKRTTEWERGDEPMTQFAFSGDYDAYGQARRQLSIAVPRYRDHRESAAVSDPYLATSVETVYAQRDDHLAYIVNRIAKTTTYEIVNDGRPSLNALLASLARGGAQRTIVDQTLSFYDGPAFQGLPLGEIGDHGALVRTEKLILTSAVLHDAYRSGDITRAIPEEPPYLTPSNRPQWTPDYPQAFRDEIDSTARLAGYVHRQGGAASVSEEGYFVVVEQRGYDFQRMGGGRRGLVVARRDPLDHETTVTYDVPYDLFPVRIIDPVALETAARHDYRVLQAEEVTDANGNRQRVTFTPLGLPHTMVVMGKVGENAGDTQAVPGSTLTYDFMAFVDRAQPISVRTVQRIHHVTDPDASGAERDDTVEFVEYSDGFGRLLQRRTLAEDIVFGNDAIFGAGDLPADQALPGGDAIGRRMSRDANPHVVVSAWQIYDNKQRVIERYEPFFSRGWDYATPTGGEWGQKSVMKYDPRGRVTRTVRPDGAEERAVFGVPDQAGPERFMPTPWETYTYDANDNAGRTHASGDPTHWETPTSVKLDALGRTVETVQRNGPNPLTDWYVTHSTYDIRGNLLTVADPLNRVTFRYVYDFAARPLRVESLDAGVRRTVLDAAGKEIERRDSKGALILQAFDSRQRPIRVWSRDDAASEVRLRERLEYGDGSDSNQPAGERDDSRRANRLGRLHRHYDEAGRLTFEAYDFKGNPAEKVRQVLREDVILGVFQGPPARWRVEPFRVSWEPQPRTRLDDHARGLLDFTEYRESIAYDALSRIRLLRYPADVNGVRKELRPRYNRGGALQAVDLDRETYVRHIAYNVRGQRTLVAFGNGLLTRCAYDPVTFRLVRLRTEGYERPPRTAFVYRPTGPLLQDLAYTYDLAGNIVSIVDRTPGCGVRNNPDAASVGNVRLARTLAAGNALLRRFEYDPLYRLRAATGRESDAIPRPRSWTDDRREGFGSGNHGSLTQGNAPGLTSLYREEYTYDPSGNLVALTHRRGRTTWTRHFGFGGLTHGQWDSEWRARLGSAAPWLAPRPNRLTHVGEQGPPNAQSHFYDPNGNLTRETSSRHFEWDDSDRLKAFRVQAGDAEPSIHAQYFYDSGGQRVMKVVRRQGGQPAVAVYIDRLFEHHRWRADGQAIRQGNRLHVMDGKERVALIRIGDRQADDASPAVQYHLGDHLGSSHVVVSDAADWINREEYFPYGETSLGSFARKGYRFAGGERDEECGLYYFGARYYAPHLGRWVSCDPAGLAGEPHLYSYSGSNPVNRIDPTGTQDDPPPSYAATGEDIPTQNVTPRQFQEICLRQLRQQSFVQQRGFPTYYVRELGLTDLGAIIEGEIGTIPVNRLPPGSLLTAHLHEVSQVPSGRDITRLAEGGFLAPDEHLIVQPRGPTYFRVDPNTGTGHATVYNLNGTQHHYQIRPASGAGGQGGFTLDPVGLATESTPLVRAATQAEAVAETAKWAETAKALSTRAGLWGITAAKWLGFTAGVIGGYNEANKTYEAVAPGALFNKPLCFSITFVGAVAAGWIDDAFVVATGGAYAGHVAHMWDTEGAGPTQVFVGNIVRGVDALWYGY